MAKVLVLETDPVLAALIEDRLHVAGHRTILADDPAKVVSEAADGEADLVILTLELETFSGLGVVRQLRERSETQSLPVVALSQSGDSGDRIAALRAGADDYLTKPFDIEELLLRVDRILGRRGEAPPVMQGDLASHPVWELVQYIQQAGKSGELSIHGAGGSGQLEVKNGTVVKARWQKLRGREALLALLDTREGQFRLTTGVTAGDGASGFKIQEVLMESAWLQDELGKRRGHLPATGAPLQKTADRLPEMDDELRELPIERIFEALGSRPGTRLYDLVDQADEAPAKIRLAVAWLVEQGAIGPEKAAAAGGFMNTVEISSSMVLDLSIQNLLSAAGQAGFDPDTLSYLVLAEAGVKGQLMELFENEPGLRSHPGLQQLNEQLQLRQGGSADFPTDAGTMSLHVQILGSSVRSQVEAVVPGCAGVFLWLDQARDEDLIRSVIQRLEAVEGSIGVLISANTTELTHGTQRWRTAHDAPRSLIGILRLLHPRAAA